MWNRRTAGGRGLHNGLCALGVALGVLSSAKISIYGCGSTNTSVGLLVDRGLKGGIGTGKRAARMDSGFA